MVLFLPLPPPSFYPPGSEEEQKRDLQQLMSRTVDLRQCCDLTVDPSPFRVSGGLYRGEGVEE